MDGGFEVPTVLHRFSVREYHRMARTGMFDQQRIELIDGAVVDMAPIGTPHTWAIGLVTRLFAPLMVQRRANVLVQCSILLDDFSEPEPDVAVLAWDADQTIHPGPVNTLLLIEVADSSLSFDRTTKARLYAKASIREFWIVNLVDRVVEVHRAPGPDGYGEVATVPFAGHLAPLALPDFEVAVADIFPPAAA